MLRVTLHINAEQIADYEIRRVTNVDRLPEADDVSTYEVRSIPDMELVSTGTHRYGDGAHALAGKFLIACGRRDDEPLVHDPEAQTA